MEDLCARHKILEQTFYRSRIKFGGMDVGAALRLKDLKSENERLTRLTAEQWLTIDDVKELCRKKECLDCAAAAPLRYEQRHAFAQLVDRHAGLGELKESDDLLIRNCFFMPLLFFFETGLYRLHVESVIEGGQYAVAVN
ncbi:transposase [Pandoraea iniqua]|uniref:Transposase n=1 Tax=Pandoraea iniqua TaxID=2508288 RepID=A0A5E4YEB2_9BURK|nr:transposase [Pandoraea iniqua]